MRVKCETGQESRPKVLALYKGVLELLDEGANVNSLKVSDITERAGIGKGTAYDYFKSREEIITGAVIYDLERQAEECRRSLEEFHCFEERIRYCFDWITKRLKEQKSFARFLYLTAHSSSIGQELLEEMKRRKASGDVPLMILRELCEQGKAEGVIRGELSAEAAAFLLFGSLITLVMYMEHHGKDGESLEVEKMRELLCEGFLKQVK